MHHSTYVTDIRNLEIVAKELDRLIQLQFRIFKEVFNLDEEINERIMAAQLMRWLLQLYYERLKKEGHELELWKFFKC